MHKSRPATKRHEAWHIKPSLLLVTALAVVAGASGGVVVQMQLAQASWWQEMILLPLAKHTLSPEKYRAFEVSIGATSSPEGPTMPDFPVPEPELPSVQPTACGDGIVEDGEECDNGVLDAISSGSSCRPDCRWARCGDGVVDPGEECDDGGGNGQPGDSCSANCTREICGNGVCEPGEDGNCVLPSCPPGSACSSYCFSCGIDCKNPAASAVSQ